MKKAGILISKILTAALIIAGMPGYISADTYTMEANGQLSLKEFAYYTDAQAGLNGPKEYSMAGDDQYSIAAQGLLIYYRQQWNYYDNLAQNARNDQERLNAAADRDAQYFSAQLVRWEDRYTGIYKIKGADRDLIDKNGRVLLKEAVIQKDGTSVTGEIKIRPNGQEQSAEGYGQIVIPELYVYTKASETLRKQAFWPDAKVKALQKGMACLTSDKTVSNVPGFTMNDLDYRVNNCVLTAVTRIVQTLFNRHKLIGGMFRTLSDKQVYASVRSIAEEKYNYTNEAGVPFPNDIDNLVNDALDKYGFLIYNASNKYFIDANFNIMKTSVDSNLPFLLNSSAQDVSTECIDIHVTGNPTYPDHTVTVTGYQEYSTNQGVVRLLKVYDGWSGTPRYIDYDEFLKGAKVFDSDVDGYSITIIK